MSKYLSKKRLLTTSLLLLGVISFVEAHRRRLTIEDSVTPIDENMDIDGEDGTTTGHVSYKIQSAPIVKGVEEEVVDFGQPDESGETNNDDEEAPPAPVITKKAAKKKVFLPEMLLLDPKPRLLMNLSEPNNQPCGGLEKGPVHYLASPGSKALLQWKVTHPSLDGNCTVRVGHGLD